MLFNSTARGEILVFFSLLFSFCDIVINNILQNIIINKIQKSFGGGGRIL